MRQESQTSMATQVMRAQSKSYRRQDETLLNSEDLIAYDHTADYSILFNGPLLDAWWRSTIVFKIFCRSPGAIGVTGKTATAPAAPYLVGVARLHLKSLLKSRNFRLYKKLAILDHLNELEASTYSQQGKLNFNSTKKRIGTLHVKIELLSDLKEFNTTLIKLNKSSGLNTSSRSRTNAKNDPKSTSTTGLTTNNASKLEHDIQSVRQSNAKPAEVTRTILNTRTNSTSHINAGGSDSNEYSVPIQMFLSINDGRGFNSNKKLINNAASASIGGIYLICRLFWTREKVKFESSNNSGSGSDGLFCWTLSLSFMLRRSIIDNMKNNFMILEAWKASSSSGGGEQDTLIGTIKLPLHEFYIKFNDETFLNTFLSNKNAQPLIGVDGWISACDPFTGQKAGEINVSLLNKRFTVFLFEFFFRFAFCH
jgi:C2 domain-containing protein 3